MSDRSVVIANAGSGKTYVLANRLIRWMLLQRQATGNSSPEQILAITFTRKAAGEIVQRVLRHLALGATDSKHRAAFAVDGQVGAAVNSRGGIQPFHADDYAAVLADFVQALHRVSISTIDGFFVQLAGAFSAELGLPEGWRIGEEEQLVALRDDVIGRVIGADPKRALELARSIASGQPKAEVQGGIDESLRSALELWKRCTLAADPQAPWRALLDHGFSIFPKAKRLRAAELKGLGTRMQQVELPLTKAGAPYSLWLKASSVVWGRTNEEDWFGVIESPLVKALFSHGTYCNVEPPKAFCELLVDIVSHALSYVQDVIRSRMSATAEMAQLVGDALEVEQRSTGSYGFNDLCVSLARAQAIGGEGIQIMRERLDRSIRDLALDEFQDTSPEQWFAISPLVDEIMATGDRRMLVVGDPKQSIYAWRGGTPALLRAVQDREGLSSDTPLATSYRSSPVILEFVNALFGDLQSVVGRSELNEQCPGAEEALRSAGLPIPAGVERSPLLRALNDWTFVPHQAAQKNSRMPGLVQAFRSEDKERDSLADCVAEVVAQRTRLRPDASIAVLVRTNKDIASCVAAIRDRGIAVSDEGRSPLLDSAAVYGLLALLKIAEHPGDRIAYWTVTREPLCGMLGIEPMESHGGHSALTLKARELSRKTREQLHAQGLAAWVDGMVERIRPACARHDLERLWQLSVMAHAAPLDVLARPGSFVRLVAARGSRTAARERVRVMTVHASKGLEFDEVVLGSLDQAIGEVKSGIGSWAVLATDPTVPPVAVAPVVGENVRLFSPVLAAFYREAQSARFSDDVSGLYVAITRAREALHLICAPPFKNDEPRPTATWLLRLAVPSFEVGLRAAAGDGLPFWKFQISDATLTQANAQVEFVDLAESSGEIAGGVESESSAGAASVQRSTESDQVLTAVTRKQAPSMVWDVRKTIVARAPSAHGEETQNIFVKKFSGLQNGSRGLLAHAWFELVGWLDGSGIDPSIEPFALRAVAIENAGPVDSALAAGVRESVARACLGSLGACLRRDRYSNWKCESITVHNEMPFAVEIEGSLVRGRMDRVVLGIRGGGVVRAEVVDWKTGAEGLIGEALAVRIEPYRSQMNDYRRALAGLFGLDAQTATALLAFVDRDEMVEIGGDFKV